MITLYGRTYAATAQEAVGSLFNSGGTVNGTYRKAAAGVYLLDLQGNERAFIRKDGLGPVSVGKHDGRRFYMHSTSSADDLWLGTPESYSATRDGTKQLAALIFAEVAA